MCNFPPLIRKIKRYSSDSSGKFYHTRFCLWLLYWNNEKFV